MTTISIGEKWSGTRDSYYIYVVEGKTLRHISNYAIRKEESEEFRFYEIPIEKFKSKPIIRFRFKKNGVCRVSEHRIEHWTNSINPTGYNWSYLLEKEGVRMLEGYSFEINDPKLKQLVSTFETTYKRMIDEIKDYFERLNAELIISRHAERTYDAFKDVRACYFSCLAIPDDERRIKSLRRVCEWIYQLWVLKLICESLGAEEVVRMGWWEVKPRVWIEQGKPHPCCVIKTPLGYFACYFEPQAHELIHLSKMFTGKREFVRPDIAVVRLDENEVREIFYKQVISRFDLIVECKVRRINGRDLKQVTAYVNDFQPNTLIIVSFEKIPNKVRKTLDSRNILLVDGLNPSNIENINTFRNRVRDQFKLTLTAL